jgi:hypothetical protein
MGRKNELCRGLQSLEAGARCAALALIRLNKGLLTKRRRPWSAKSDTAGLRLSRLRKALAFLIF